MDIVTLGAGLLLSSLVGIAALLVLRCSRYPLAAPGEVAWLAGAGSLAGAFLVCSMQLAHDHDALAL